MRVLSISACWLANSVSDNPMPVFSFMGNASQHRNRCRVTSRIPMKTHDVIHVTNLDRSPMAAGGVEDRPTLLSLDRRQGDAFCRRNQHQIFLEPEGLTSNEIYLTVSPLACRFDVRMQIVRSMQNQRTRKIVRHWLRDWYDFFDPHDLKPRHWKYLFTACSLLVKSTVLPAHEGSCGAGKRSLVTNAARLSADKRGLGACAFSGLSRRALVDDLCTLGTKEPYRMFTLPRRNIA